MTRIARPFHFTRGAVVPTALMLLAAFVVGWLAAAVLTAAPQRTTARVSPIPGFRIATPITHESVRISLAGADDRQPVGDAGPGGGRRVRPDAPTFGVWELHIHALHDGEQGRDAAASHDLAAWQVRITLTNATVVGIEGGSNPRFTDAPAYLPRALAEGALVLAAYSIEPAPDEFADGLAEGHPNRDSRHVATLHLRVTPNLDPIADLLVEAVAASDGTPLRAQATLFRRDAQ